MREIRQRDYKDCGVTSMKYIIEYYHGFVPLEKLRDDTFTDTSGTTAYHMIEAFKKYGFDAYGAKIEYEDLEYVILPCIVHLVLENGLEHFAVLCKVKRNEVVLMDPAFGKRKLKKKGFLSIWDHIIIQAIPSTKILKIPKERKTLHVLLELAKREKKYLCLLIVFGFLLSIFTIFSSFYLKVSMEYIRGDFAFLKQIILLFLGMYILRLFLEYGKGYLKIFVDKNIDLNYMFSFLRHLFSLPVSKFMSYHEGEIVTRVEEAKMIKDLFEEVFVTFFLEAILSFFSIAVLCFINFKLSKVLVLGMFFYFLMHFICSKRIYFLLLKHMEIERKWNESVLENVRLFLSIKHLNQEQFQKEILERTICQTSKERMKEQKELHFYQILRTYFIEFLFFLITTYSICLLRKNEISILDFFTFQNLYFYFISPIKELTDIFPKFYYLKGIFQKINETMGLEEEKIDVALKMPAIKIDIVNLSFSYNHVKTNLNHITLSIQDKEHVFLAGSSGCGKSTLAKILHGELMDYEGDIFFHQKNLKDYTLSEVRASVIYLSQNECIMNATIEENILFGSVKTALFDKICGLCEIDAIVREKPFRYHTFINQAMISGGERQRIILARTLLKEGSFYILDECLSEVEEEMELNIIRRLREFLKHKTLIYISHTDHGREFERKIVL